MDDKTDKLKGYINEISLLSEKDFFDSAELIKCFKSFELTEGEVRRLDEIAAVHTRRSDELLKKGNLEEALISMERAVQIHPLNQEFRNRIAQLYLQKSHRESSEGRNRELARKHAAFSLRINGDDPITRTILKDIKQKEKKLSGQTPVKKLILPLAGLLVLIIAAVLSRSTFTFPLFRARSEETDSDFSVPSAGKPEQFSERELETRLNGSPEDISLNIDRSVIAKTNGSFSYTLQGEFIHEKSAVTFADLNITFNSYDGNSLFTRKVPLVRSDLWLLPGEPLLIDEFFYVHYLPPEIDEIRLSLDNLTLADKEPEEVMEIPLALQWGANRPEGVKISISQAGRNLFEGYGEDFINLKLIVENSGTVPITQLEAELKWRDLMGDDLYSVRKNLIRNNSPSLQDGEERILRLFTSLPSGLLSGKPEFYIKITRINS